MMTILLFERSQARWWRKPLVRTAGRDLPAELVILQKELRPGESGAWLNSRGVTSGVVDLIADQSGKPKTRRVQFPQFVANRLREVYARAGVAKGAPDLVIWNDDDKGVRFVEVKCPDWDKPSAEQLLFHGAARALGIDTTIVEWRFSGN